jgi:signal transduction histidine kinase
MTSFAAGNRIARASERGPDELRSIAIQFNRMADALSRQYENQLVFLTGIAHDLRNPLFPIKMAASVASPDQPLPPDDKVRSMLSIVKRQVDRLDRMIGDLLDASRIEAGKLELRVESQDARSLAREVANLFEAASSKHRIELQIPEAPVPLYCDAFRIEQVLNNLVSNAIKYSPNGGRVQIGVESDSGCAVFKVTDEGMGIRDEDRPLVFEPFRRIRSADREIPGTGLGLSVARRIVEAHKGRLDLKSEFGKGSTFIVCIPANAAVSAEAA